MSALNKSLAVLAALAFLLPFVSFSCSSPYGKFSVDLTGAKLAQCAVKTCSARDIYASKLGPLARNVPEMPDTDEMQTMAKRDLGLNLVLFAAIAVVVAAITVFFGKRGGELLSGVASVGGIVLLFMFRSKFSDAFAPGINSPEAQAVGALLKVELQFAMGFWAAAVLSATSAILAFKGTSAAHAPTPASGSIGGFSPHPPSGVSSGPGAQMFSCPSCGASTTAGNKFCLSCGGSLAAPAPPAQPVVTSAPAAPAAAVPAPAATTSLAAAQVKGTCSSCGASNPGGNKFCLSCGNSLMASVQLFQPKETNTPAAPPHATSTAPAVAAADQQGGDIAWLNAPAPMAAAAAAAPAGKPLPATASSREPEPPASPISSPAPEAREHQRSLDLRAPQPEPPQTSGQTCAACGAAMTGGQKFCLSCGTPVGRSAKPPETPARVPQVSEPEPPPHEPVCATCSAALAEGQKFCLACGTPVSHDTGISPAHASAATAQTQLFEAPPKRSAKTAIIVIVLVALLGAGGYFGWKYFAGPDVTVSTFPQRTHVAMGGRTSLQATISGSKDTDIDWTIQEGTKGGQVNSLGTVMVSGQARAAAVYIAPQTSGVFHVIATSHANSNRSAKIEIVVGGSAPPDTAATPQQPAPTPPADSSAPTPATSTPAASTSTPVSPMAAQIVGTWRGPSTGMQTVIGADSTIAMTSQTDATKNLNGTYHFTDKSHLQIDFGNGDVRTWEIVGVDNNYMRVTSQSKEGSSAIIFAKVQ